MSVGSVENVWDYPRPPAVEPCRRRVSVELGGQILADSRRALRVLETSHPPTIYIPRDDVRHRFLVPSRVRPTWCEFKGAALYQDAVIEGLRHSSVAWTYPEPSAGYVALTDHFAFYPGRVDRASLDEETVRAQEGDFYGGWITAELAGPFKGPPNTAGW